MLGNSILLFVFMMSILAPKGKEEVGEVRKEHVVNGGSEN